MKRYGQVIRLRPGMEARYRELHLSVWPAVLARIAECGIRNYTIYLRDGWLFATFEYHGDDFAADMAKMAADPETQRWWRETDPCQEPAPFAKPGEWWAGMDEVFHVE